MVSLRALAVWLVLMGAEILHGTFRVLLLAPRLGDFRARQLAVFSGATLILAITYACIGWVLARAPRELFAIGALWVALTLAFDVGVGRWGFRYSWSRIASDYDLVHGELLPLGLAVMLGAPLLAASLRGVRAPSGAPTVGKVLRVVKIVHTMIWGFFAGSIVAIPIFGWARRYDLAAVFTGIAVVEVFVLIFNGWRCPLTVVAARYTEDRRDNFDIYLPVWLARQNKSIFGSLLVVGVLFTVARWIGWLG